MNFQRIRRQLEHEATKFSVSDSSDPELIYGGAMPGLARLQTGYEQIDVQLMTMHASKGLEFPHVFIIGMEENLLPHRASVEDGNIEEERRLAYVGITRAQQTLAMTMAAKRRQFGETINCEPSRFIDELPQDDLTWQGGGTDDEQANEERGQETLTGLRGLFA